MIPQLDIESLFQSLRLFLLVVWSYILSIYFAWPRIWWWYQAGAYTFTIVGTIIALWLAAKIMAIRAKEKAALTGAVLTSFAESSATTNPRWQAITSKVQTDNPADWKLAIIEADTILDEMVKRMGYVGDNLGERLKTVEVSDFLTLNDAWEAHKIRNQIAHDGNFQLDKRKTAQVIAMYERVFNEFGYI